MKLTAALLAFAALLPAALASAQTPAQTPAPAGPQARTAPGCAAVSLPGLPACAEAPNGLVFAPTQEDAQRTAGYAAAGEDRFRRHFNRSPPTYAVVLGQVTPEVTRTLHDAGVKPIMPWLTAEGRRAAFADSIRRAAESMGKARGLDAAKTEELHQSMLSQRAANLSASDRDSGVVPHELGHMWLIESFWPGARADRNGHYGGPAADWLDETAAILMEDERLTNERRDQFRTIYTGRRTGAGPLPAGRPDPLSAFLTKDHPLKNDQEMLKLQAQAQAKAGGISGPQILMMTQEQRQAGAAPGADIGAGPRFYLQGRAFADFLIDRTGDPTVFAQIAAAFASGDTMDGWLAKRGGALGLGSSVAEMDGIWRGWLQARFGPPAASAG